MSRHPGEDVHHKPLTTGDRILIALLIVAVVPVTWAITKWRKRRD